MRVLILQVEIGSPCYRDLKHSSIGKDFKQYLRPTVLEYCHRHGYDYRLITKCPEDYDISWFRDSRDIFRNIGTTLVRYYYMAVEGYDIVVSLDNDIYVTPWAETIPEVKGHYGIHDITINSRKVTNLNLARSLKNIPYEDLGIGVINGGVQIVDHCTGLLVKQYFKRICKNKLSPPGDYYSDQNYINYFRYRNPDKSFLLDQKWNYMANRNTYTDFKSINFVHYNATNGRELFYRDLANGLLTNCSEA
jgi:hypothetical protein